MYVSRFIGRSLLVGCTIAGLVRPALAADAGTNPGATRGFASHAAIYAKRHPSSAALDPDVFVADAQAEAGEGPERIRHVAGFRPARPDDDAAQPVYAANGTPLQLSLGRWFAARGDARTASDDGRVSLRFSHLVPFATYSLFALRRGAMTQRFEPLRDVDNRASFLASSDGDARLSVVVPDRERYADLALVLHSDDAAHDSSPGDLGVNAHVQLVLASNDAARAAYAVPAADEAPVDGDVDTDATDDDAAAPRGTPAPAASPAASPADDDMAPGDAAPPDDREATPAPSDDDATHAPDDEQSSPAPDTNDDHDAPPTDSGDGGEQAPI